MSGSGIPDLSGIHFQHLRRMSAMQFKRWRTWERWLLRLILEAHMRGYPSDADPMDPVDHVQEHLHALHAGALELADRMEGRSLLATMPEVPQVWPRGYPVPIVVAVLGYLAAVGG